METNGNNLPATLDSRGELTLDGYTKNLEQKFRMAGILCKSGILPSRYKTPEAVLTAVLYAAEIGFAPMQGLLAIYVIDGVPTLDASGIKAKVYEHGGDVLEEKWDEKECTLTMTRPGKKPKTFTYTIEDARKAQLLDKSNWKKNPKAMLYARCVSTLGRNQYPDILRGVYGKEEMLDAIEVTPQIANPQVEVLPAVTPVNPVSKESDEEQKRRQDVWDMSRDTRDPKKVPDFFQAPKQATPTQSQQGVAYLNTEGPVWVYGGAGDKFKAFMAVKDGVKKTGAVFHKEFDGMKNVWVSGKELPEFSAFLLKAPSAENPYATDIESDEIPWDDETPMPDEVSL